MSDNENRGFRFNPEISLGDIFMVGAILIPLVVWGVRTESRLSVLEFEASQNQTVVKEIKDSLLRIEAKMDGKADKH